MTLRDTLATPRRRWLTIAATALVGLAASAGVTLWVTTEQSAIAEALFSTLAPAAVAPAAKACSRDEAPNVFLVTAGGHAATRCPCGVHHTRAVRAVPRHTGGV